MSVRICIPSKEIRRGCIVCTIACLGRARSEPRHVQYPPAGGDDLAVALGGAGVGHLGDLRRLGEAADHVALRGGLRVAGGGEDDGHRPVVVELGGGAGEAAGLAGGEEELGQVGAQPRQHRLRLGVAEAGVELEHLRALGADHQAGVEDAVEGDAAGGHRRDDRAVDPLDDLLDLGRRRSRGPASSCPCRRCSGPGRRRRSACSPGPGRAGRRSRRRRSPAARAPRPRGTPRARPWSAPKRRSVKKTSIASRASASSWQMITPLPAASPSALSTVG